MNLVGQICDSLNRILCILLTLTSMFWMSITDECNLRSTGVLCPTIPSVDLG